MKKLILLAALAAATQCTKKESAKKATPEDKQEPKNQLSAVYEWPPQSNSPFEVLPEDRRLAKNYYIVLDGSGSMKETKCADGRRKYQVAIDALRQFAENVPPSDHLGLFVFDNRGVQERLALGINNRDQFNEELSKVTVGGSTPLGSAMEKGKSRLEHQARMQLGYGEFNLVVVTDGEADSDDLPNKAVDYLVNETPVIVQTIGFCIGSDHTLNQPRRTVYKSANNPKELLSSLEEVLAESETFTDAQFEN